MSDSIPRVDYAIELLDGPPDVEFRVFRMWFVEEVNTPFELTLDITTETQVDVRDLLGVSIELILTRDAAHARHIYGVVAQAELLGASREMGSGGNEGQLLIRIVVVPSVKLLQQGTACRIFQEQSVQDVLKKVLDPVLAEYGRTYDPGKQQRGNKPRDYCVQYHESDYDFTTRLLQEEGINYFFKHDDGKKHEVLTFAEANDAFEDILNTDGECSFPFGLHASSSTSVESLQSFSVRTALVTTGVRRLDYDIMDPHKPLMQETVEKDKMSRVRRLYFSMGRRYVLDDVAARKDDHLEVARLGGEVFVGESNAIGFRSGGVFALDGDEVPGTVDGLLVTRVVHTGTDPEAFHYQNDQGDDFVFDGPRYGNRFECIPAKVPLRPAQVTPKPKIEGVQTGIVSGPSGEEIHTDELGRIVVQFHWEEESTYDQTSSCWIRVAQSWAGPGWGAVFLPRIGMEVVVTFIEGNPDRPLVTGCVYNGKFGVPYPLPDEKTKSTIKSESSPGGDGFNELRFEDAKGKEEVFLNAQKDFNEHVGNDHSTQVDANQTNTVNIDRTRTTKGNEFVTIHGNQTIEIKGVPENQGDKQSPFKGSTTNIDGHHKMVTSDTAYLEAPNQIQFVCGGSSITMVPGKITISAGDGSSLTLDANAFMKSSQGTEVLLDANARTTASTGGNILVDANVCGTAQAGGEILLDANACISGSGGGSVLCDANVLAASAAGNQMLVDASQALLQGTSAKVVGVADATVSAPSVSVSGAAKVAVSGAMVTLN